MVVFRLLFIPLLLIQVGYLNYTNPEKDYSFEVGDGAHYMRKEMDKGYIDIFTVLTTTKPEVFNYAITVTKEKNEEAISLEKLLSPEFKNSFESTCNCVVTKSKEVKYKNFSGVLFDMTMKSSKNSLVGYSF